MRKTLAASLLAVAVTGCMSSSDVAQLSIQKSASDQVYTADFDRALFSQDGSQTDVVLLSGNDQTAPGAATNTPGVRQTVHLKVLWQPTHTIRLDSPSSSNAMINWVVSAGDNDKVTYTGSCWARVRVDGDEAVVDLREANVGVKSVTGHMADPLTHAKLEGKFIARRSDSMVRAAVSDLGTHGNATAALPIDRTATP